MEARERHTHTRVHAPREAVLKSHGLEFRRERWVHPDFEVSLLQARLQVDPGTEGDVGENAERAARAETSSLVCGIARAELSGADEREAIEHIASRSSDPELTSMGLEYGGVEGRAPRVPGLVRMLMLELTESLEHLGGEVVLDRRF